jgi:hypothetical protein
LYFDFRFVLNRFINEYTTTSENNVGLVVSLIAIDPFQQPILAVPSGGQYSLKQISLPVAINARRRG